MYDVEVYAGRSAALSGVPSKPYQEKCSVSAEPEDSDREESYPFK
jgi:hypothetical protein